MRVPVVEMRYVPMLIAELSLIVLDHAWFITAAALVREFGESCRTD
ncbi:MAG: hypothetical protein FWD57_05345 [Polyangiaceae bacterium]|nr:hypothetical protein [Polyangiaceae bacterium]